MTKRSTIHEHFKKYVNDEGKRRAACNYCQADADDNATRMKAHIFGGEEKFIMTITCALSDKMVTLLCEMIVQGIAIAKCAPAAKHKLCEMQGQ